MDSSFLREKHDQLVSNNMYGLLGQETKRERPPTLPAKRNPRQQISGNYENYPITMSAPSLPPKGKPNPSVSQPISSHSQIAFQAENLNYYALPQPGESPKSPASFLNPLFALDTATNSQENIRKSPDSFTSDDTSSVYSSERTTPTKRTSFDTDSIYFLENHNPSLTKVEQAARRRSSLKEFVRKPMDHVYELCEVKDEKEEEHPRRGSTDIFDLVSFKSPLYGTLKKKEPAEDVIEEPTDVEDLTGQFYDIPSFLPPSYPPPPLPPPDKVPEVPPRLKPPPIPQRTSASTTAKQESAPVPDWESLQKALQSKDTASPQNTDDQHIYEAGPRDEDHIVVKQKPSCSAAANTTKARPPSTISSLGGVQLCGHLYRVQNNGKEIHKRWLSLENGALCCYEDPKADTAYKRIDLKSIAGVSMAHSVVSNHPDTKASEMWYFEIYFHDECHWLLGARLPSERWDWIAQLSLVIAPPVWGLIPPTRTGIQSVGEIYLKEGIAGSWQKGFFTLTNRILNILNYEGLSLKSINLQHISAVEKESSRISCATARESGIVFHLNLPQQVLYLQCDWRSFTESLLEAVQQSWVLPHHAGLVDQYLTPENVPVIIDKCLKFVSTHGTLLEGIYRLSGSSTKVRQLLESFSRDVWNVHLKLEDYSPHDVASALKRYLRNLPECLLTEKQFSFWGKASQIENKTKRLQTTFELLSHLPEVNYQTLKKLIGHLCMITEHSNDNLMPTINIAPVFGPTLLYKASFDLEEESYNATTLASDIVADLITNYTQLFKVKPEELEKERKILLAVQKLKDSKFIQKPAGDILMGVYIYNKDWGKCINIRLTPSTTAKDVCEYAVSVAQIRVAVSSLAVMEIVCGGELKRPLHYTERVLEVTMRWLSWGQEEAKANYLLIEHNIVYDSIIPIAMRQNALSVFGEMSFADSPSKSFKKLTYEFTAAKLKIYKSSKNSQTNVGEWNVEDIVWFLGVDAKRSPPTSWTLSFVNKKASFKRSKSTPYFGWTICCKTQEDLHKLVAAMLIAEYPQGLQFSPTLPDLLS